MDPKSREIRSEIEALREDLSQRIEELRDRATQAVDTTKDAIHAASEAAREQVSRLDESAVADWIRDRPLLAVGASLAVGYVLGQALNKRRPTVEGETEIEVPQSPAGKVVKDELQVFKDMFVKTAMQTAAMWAADRLRSADTSSTKH